MVYIICGRKYKWKKDEINVAFFSLQEMLFTVSSLLHFPLRRHSRDTIQGGNPLWAVCQQMGMEMGTSRWDLTCSSNREATVILWGRDDLPVDLYSAHLLRTLIREVIIAVGRRLLSPTVSRFLTHPAGNTHFLPLSFVTNAITKHSLTNYSIKYLLFSTADQDPILFALLMLTMISSFDAHPHLDKV